jgi:hypothetical protein
MKKYIIAGCEWEVEVFKKNHPKFREWEFLYFWSDVKNANAVCFIGKCYTRGDIIPICSSILINFAIQGTALREFEGRLTDFAHHQFDKARFDFDFSNIHNVTQWPISEEEKSSLKDFDSTNFYRTKPFPFIEKNVASADEEVLECA